MAKYDEQERKELVDKARKMYESGKSVSEITEEIGISWVTMYRWMKEEGVQMRPPVQRNRKKYDLETLRKLAEEGLGPSEIGKRWVRRIQRSEGGWTKTTSRSMRTQDG